MRCLEIKDKEAGQRLDKFLGKYLNMAGKSFLYKMIRKKNITLNGKKCDGSEKLAAGDQVRLFLSDETIDKFSQVCVQKVKKQNLDIVYEDRHILLINKPSGMLSQKAKPSDESLVEYVTDYLLETGQIKQEELRSFHPSVCNRLDRNTSGLVAAGKTLAGLQALSDLFKTRSLEKYYLCAVRGVVEKKQVINGFLEKDSRTNQVTVYSEKNRTDVSVPICTEYEPIAVREGNTLLKVKLITGRTHQIRAHLASVNHPVLGDSKYGDGKVNEEMRRRYKIRSQMLHAHQLIFPQTKGPLADLSGKSFTAPAPPLFKQVFGYGAGKY